MCPDLLILTDNTTVPVATVFAGYIAYDANRTCGGIALAPLGVVGRGALSPPPTGTVPAGLYGLKDYINGQQRLSGLPLNARSLKLPVLHRRLSA